MPDSWRTWGCLVWVLAFGAVQGEEIKLASIAPEGSHWIRDMRAGSERIRELTEGRVTIKLYPGGVMGNDAQVLRKMRIGQLHGGAFAAGGLVARYSGFNLYGIPLLFHSLEEVDYVRERIDPKLEAGLERAGLVSLGFSEGGFANLMANEPIRNVQDLMRKKIWVPEGDQISFLAMEALGLSPVVLPVTDVLTGLQTGLLDVTAASPVTALVLQWHTKVRYRTELPVSYSMGVLAIEAGIFRRLNTSDQDIVREVMGEIMAGLDQASRDDNREARVVLQRSGVMPVDVDLANLEGWRRTVKGTYPELRRRPDIDVALFDELLAALAEYRSQAPSLLSGR